MRRILWPLVLVVVCLPLLLLAAGVRLPWLSPSDQEEPEPVPGDDYEIVWLNTATSGATWARFVTGVQAVTGIQVDVSAAFPHHSNSTPEVVISLPIQARNLRIRWYKLSTIHNEKYWVGKLAMRQPNPLAFIGGSSSDRARDLAWTLHQQDWPGEKPLFFITNATAESVQLSDGSWKPLIELYQGRTFRICFSNSQMAEAMTDFVWQNPQLKPQGPPLQKPLVFSVCWNDDPYSVDMDEQFKNALIPRHIDFKQYKPMPFSVGSFFEPNLLERKYALDILQSLREHPDQRALVVVPTVTTPARRFLRTLCEADPVTASRLVALNGDGMGVNVVLRDGDLLWPAASLPIPLVLFTHADPTNWKQTGLSPPSSTDDVLHTAELIHKLVRSASYPAMISGADEMAMRLHSLERPFFDAVGNRLKGTGEFIFLLKPRNPESDTPLYEVWQRDRDWHPVARDP